MKVVYCDELKAGETICVGDLLIKSTIDKYVEEKEREVV